MILLKNCKLIITNDSALLHIAGAFDISTISIFGPTSPLDKVPFGANHTYFYKNLECSPCYKYGKFPECKTVKCLKQIKPEEIFCYVKKIFV